MRLGVVDLVKANGLAAGGDMKVNMSMNPNFGNESIAAAVGLGVNLCAKGNSSVAKDLVAAGAIGWLSFIITTRFGPGCAHQRREV